MARARGGVPLHRGPAATPRIPRPLRFRRGGGRVPTSLRRDARGPPAASPHARPALLTATASPSPTPGPISSPPPPLRGLHPRRLRPRPVAGEPSASSARLVRRAQLLRRRAAAAAASERAPTRLAGGGARGREGERSPDAEHRGLEARKKGGAMAGRGRAPRGTNPRALRAGLPSGPPPPPVRVAGSYLRPRAEPGLRRPCWHEVAVPPARAPRALPPWVGWAGRFLSALGPLLLTRGSLPWIGPPLCCLRASSIRILLRWALPPPTHLRTKRLRRGAWH